MRCSPPCSRLEQSILPVLWECTAASPGIADHPGHPPATSYLCVSYKTNLFVPTVVSHTCSPALLGMAERWFFCCKSPSQGTQEEPSVSALSHCEVLLCHPQWHGQERTPGDTQAGRLSAHDMQLGESALCLLTTAPSESLIAFLGTGSE